MEAREQLIRFLVEDSCYPVGTAAAIVDALLAHPDLVIAALGGERVGWRKGDGRMVSGASALADDYAKLNGYEPLFRFPVREGTDG